MSAFNTFSPGLRNAVSLERPRENAITQETFLTERELAERHKRSVKTLRNARVSGTYVKFVRFGRSIRYRLSDVVEYEAANLMRSTSDLPQILRSRD